MGAEGSCNCGSVKFSIAKKVSDIYMCHCSICRKSTGSGGIAVVIVQNKDFAWLEGEAFIKTWRKPNHDWLTRFCVNCGTSVPGENDDDSIFVPVGTLNFGTQDLHIKHHLFVDSKASWEPLSLGAKQHLNGYNG